LQTRKGVIGGGAKCTSDRKAAKLRDEHVGRLIDLPGCGKQLDKHPVPAGLRLPEDRVEVHGPVLEMDAAELPAVE